MRKPHRDIVVIGAAEGSIEDLAQLVRDLPAKLPATLFVALHGPADSQGSVLTRLGTAGPIPVRTPADGSRFERGALYLAPPDRHLLLEGGHMRVLRGPKENRHRPSIDPLFRSAAAYFGPRVIGVLLGDTLDDGAAGLWAVSTSGGVTVVPADGHVTRSDPDVSRDGEIDHAVAVEDLGALIARLATEPADLVEPGTLDPRVRKEAAVEIEHQERGGPLPAGRLTAFTCPGCGGNLWQLREGSLRFRCLTGHAFTASSLLAEDSAKLEDALYGALCAMKERAAIHHEFAERMGRGHPRLAEEHRIAGKHAEEQVQVLQRILTEGRTSVA